MHVYFQKGFEGVPFIDVKSSQPSCAYLILTYDLDPEVVEALKQGDLVKVRAKKLDITFHGLRPIYEAIDIVKIEK